MISDDAFVRLVLDDAPPEQQLGAIKLSEAAEQNRLACCAVAHAALDEALEEEALAGYPVAAEVRAAMHAKVQAYVLNMVAFNIERIRLRLQGREPIH